MDIRKRREHRTDAEDPVDAGGVGVAGGEVERGVTFGIRAVHVFRQQEQHSFQHFIESSEDII